MRFVKMVIPTSLKRKINQSGNSIFAEEFPDKQTRYPLDRELYVIAKKKAIEVYLSRNHKYLGNVYFDGSYFKTSAGLMNSWGKLPREVSVDLMDSLSNYLRYVGRGMVPKCYI